MLLKKKFKNTATYLRGLWWHFAFKTEKKVDRMMRYYCSMLVLECVCVIWVIQTWFFKYSLASGIPVNDTDVLMKYWHHNSMQLYEEEKMLTLTWGIPILVTVVTSHSWFFLFFFFLTWLPLYGIPPPLPLTRVYPQRSHQASASWRKATQSGIFCQHVPWCGTMDSDGTASSLESLEISQVFCLILD